MRFFRQITSNHSKSPVASVRGMTLIELMITIVISLILLAGISTIFINSKKAYRIQEDSSVMQENSRTLINLLSNDLRMADHWGGIEADFVDVSSTGATGIGSCDGDWIVDPLVGIRGYEGGASSPLPAGCIAAGDYQPNTDVLVVRYADSDGIVTNSDAKLDGNTLYVKTTIGRDAEIDKFGTSADRIDQYNYPYQTAVYFIRPCSVKAGAACTATDDNGSPIPTLTRLIIRMVAGTPTLVQEPLIEGVEQLQLEYGIDTGDAKGGVKPDGSVDEFVAADDSELDSDEKWISVAAVRLGIIARSNKRDNTYSDTKQYDLPGGYIYTPAGDDQKFLRKSFVKTINIRNRVRS